MTPETPKPPFHSFRSALTRSTADKGIEGIEGIELDESVPGAASTNVRRDALRLLGFVEEYFAATGPGRAGEYLALAGEDDLDALLAQLEAPAQEAEGLEATQDTVRNEIARLLANPEVKADFFAILEAESRKFKAAKPTLKTVQDRERLMKLIPRRTTAMYLEDVRKGKLRESTRTAIGALEGKYGQAQREIEQARARADFNTKSLLYVQELLGYKAELREHGFATTPSRKSLLDRVLSGVAHGKKMFLVGSTGTGKTQLAMLVADLVSNGYELVSWHEGTIPRDLFGYREVGQDTDGKMQTRTKAGPVTLAITGGKIVIHEEYTAGSTRAQLAAKSQLNAKAGDEIHLPGFNGKMFTVQEGFGEVFTGNFKDERTKAREDMDPAILRMLSGVKVGFMPADELFKVVLAEMMDELGYLPLSPQDVELIRRMTQAAELMQMCHDRELAGLKQDTQTAISQVFGGRMDEVHLDKSFLDTGTLLAMFAGWDLEQAKGRTFAQFLFQKIQHFLADPKFDMDKEERKLATLILQICGVLGSNGQALQSLALDAAVWGREIRELILPSEIGKLFGEKPQEEVDIEEDLDAEKAALVAAQQALLDLLGPQGAEKKSEVQKQIEGQIDEALKLLEVFDIQTADNALPNRAQILKALESFAPQQWAEVAKLKEPTLLLVPVVGVERFEQAINRGDVKTPANARQDAIFGNFVKDSFSQTLNIIEYQLVLTDGVVDVTSQDLWNSTASMSDQERIDNFKHYFDGKQMNMLSVPAYVLLMIRAMQKGQPLDLSTVTLLDHIKNSNVVFGRWNVDQAGFYYAGLSGGNVNARLRASVMGSI